MLNDLVIDTNVLVHAQNPSEQRFSASTRFLSALLDAPTVLCVDHGFACDEAQNRSHIGTEYLQNLRAGSFALQVVATLAGSGRVRQVERRAPQATARQINQLLRNRFDRIFLSVAFNSTERILVSHDFQDFQLPKRQTIRQTLNVRVIEAHVCAPELT